MKKSLIILFLLSMTIAVGAVEQSVPLKTSNQEVQQNRRNRDFAFEKRLNLTEAQKLKAREIRKNGHEKLKPVMEQIKLKKQEAEMVRCSRMAVQMQEEKLAIIDIELKRLEKQANSIRKSNMKEFESILTREQRKILKDMKKEGRKKYHRTHSRMHVKM